MSASRNLGLDVLRGAAIALVMLRHAAPTTFGGAGIVGVTIFFTLSGFLITRILLTDQIQGHVPFTSFYVARFLRLAPPLVVVLAIYAGVEFTSHVLSNGNLWGSLVVAASYLTDLPYLPKPPGLEHLWSLAVEEQYYVVWPIILAWATSARRLNGTVAMCLTVAFFTTLGLGLMASPTQLDTVYILPTTWVPALLLGSWLAARPPKKADPLLVPALAIALLAFCCLVPDLKQVRITYALVAPLVGVATLLLIRAATARSVPRTVFSVGLAHLGRISYAAYLWNYLIARWLEAAAPGLPWAPVLGIAATILLAEASWVLLEGRLVAVRHNWTKRHLNSGTATYRGTNG